MQNTRANSILLVAIATCAFALFARVPSAHADTLFFNGFIATTTLDSTCAITGLTQSMCGHSFFQHTATGTFNVVDVSWLTKSGSPTDDVILTLYSSCSAGSLGTPVTSSSLAASSLPTSLSSSTRFTLDSSVTVTATGTKYCWGLTRSESATSSSAVLRYPYVGSGGGSVFTTGADSTRSGSFREYSAVVPPTIEFFYPYNTTSTFADSNAFFQLTARHLTVGVNYTYRVDYGPGPVPFGDVAFSDQGTAITDSDHQDLVGVPKSIQLFDPYRSSTQWWAQASLAIGSSTVAESDRITFFVGPRSGTSTSFFSPPTFTDLGVVTSTFPNIDGCPSNWFSGGLCTAFITLLVPSTSTWDTFQASMFGITERFPFAEAQDLLTMSREIEITPGNASDTPEIDFTLPSSTGGYAGLHLCVICQANFQRFHIEWFPPLVKTLITWALWVLLSFNIIAQAKWFAGKIGS